MKAGATPAPQLTLKAILLSIILTVILASANAYVGLFAGITVATAIPAYATAPALILVGVLMTQSIAQIAWQEFSEAVPAFITMLATPLTFSIATGLSLGLISYTVVKSASGKLREVNTLIWILTILFILRYVYLATD